jgi:hypothetical protein
MVTGTDNGTEEKMMVREIPKIRRNFAIISDWSA